MTRSRRTRRVLKWVGTVACVLVVAMFLASLQYVPCFARNTWCVWIDDGCFQVQWNAPVGTFLRDGFLIFGNRTPGNMQWWVSIRLTPPSMMVLPIWLILTVLIMPTAFLWWRDRRYPRGHCQYCGYDLTGNVSGRCPECGKAIKG